MLNLGNIPAGSTLYIPFASYNSSGASVTLTGLAVTDIEIYKNGSVTQRASDAGYALLDTDGIDFDGITGLHGFSVDLSDNTDSGFYSVGGFYWVIVSAVTIDSQTVTFIAATFRVVAAEAVAGYPAVDVGALSGDATAADNAEAFFDGTGYAGTNNVIPTVSSVTAVATGGITAGSIATDAIGAAELAADAVAEIADAIWDEDATGHQTGGTFGQAIGDPGANTETMYDAVVTDAAGTNVAADVIAVKAETAAILDDTDLIDDGTSGLAKIATDVAAVLVDTGTTLQAEVDGIQADTEDIQSRLPAALVSGRIDATVDGTGFEAGAAAVAADAVWDEARSGHTTQGTYGDSFNTIISGTVDTGSFTPTTTEFEADDITEATADHFIGRVIIFTSGALYGQATDITDYALSGSNGHFTVTATTEAAANDVTFVII